MARYRERHAVSGAKSDPGDAHVLAEIVRLDRAHHRPVAGDSALAEQVKVVARSHQTMIWTRQRQANTLRSMLREFYPAALAAFGDDLTDRDALAVLAAAPDPAAGPPADPARIAALLRGRAATQPRPRAAADPGRAAHRAAGRPRRAWTRPTPSRVSALVAVITELVRQIEVLEEEVRRVLASTRTLRST